MFVVVYDTGPKWGRGLLLEMVLSIKNDDMFLFLRSVLFGGPSNRRSTVLKYFVMAT